MHFVIELQSDEPLYQTSNRTAGRISKLAPNVQPQDARLSAFVDRVQKPFPQGGRVDLLVNQTIDNLHGQRHVGAGAAGDVMDVDGLEGLGQGPVREDSGQMAASPRRGYHRQP